MSYHNLFVCFAPALKMNGDCFRWLVADWRSCWKGCLTEKAALEQEYRILDDDDPLIEPLAGQSVDGYTPPPSTKSAISDQSRPDYPAILGHQASDSQRSHVRPTRELKTGRKSPSSSRERIRDDVLENARNVVAKRGNSSSRSNTPSHHRSPSQLPELSFPQPISPIFSSHHQSPS